MNQSNSKKTKVIENKNKQKKMEIIFLIKEGV